MFEIIVGVMGMFVSAADNGGVPIPPPPPDVVAEHSADVTITGHIFQPPELPPPPLAQLKVPDGFKIERYAEHLGNARILAVSPAGNVYVTRRESSDVLMIKDDGHGHAAAAPVRVVGRSGLHGITFFENKVYLVAVHEVYSADVKDDGTFGPLTMLVHDLPDAGQHHTRTIAVGPDRALYVSAGSTCNYCIEPNAENATLLRISMDGTSRGVFASGLRDTIGWGWHPRTGELWGMDQGMDWFGDDQQPEELNKIEKGKHYGWPYFYGTGTPNPHIVPPDGLSREQMLARMTPMTMGYTAHAAAMQMSFYTGTQFPAEYQGDAFVSMRGSWNRKPAVGYEIVRIHFDKGQPASIQPFVTGFLSEQGESARPCGNAMAKDGALLFTDDRNGVIYRVSYAGHNKAGSAMSPKPPAEPAKTQAMQGNVGKLAVQRPETQTDRTLKVTSAAFGDGQAIPAVYSAYEQDANFPVEWTKGPAGTQSYALIMEDPDSTTPPLPVIHWIAWNIPDDVTSLHESVAKQDRVPDVGGMRQGPNQSGAIGFHGMRPPQGDPPHHYHVQVFALSARLDDLPVGAKRDDLVHAMQGHVLAKGELVGTFARPDHPAKP
jgi:Raf kinase inhibitor-like YbhB/YbcL family protein